MLMALGVLAAHAVVSQPVEGLGIGYHLRVEEYVSGRNAEMRPSWDLDPGGEGQRLEHDTVEGYWKRQSCCLEGRDYQIALESRGHIHRVGGAKR